VGGEFIVHQIAYVVIAKQNHVPAVTAIAAVRPSFRNVLLPAEAETAVSAIARGKKHCHLIYEHSLGDPVDPLWFGNVNKKVQLLVGGGHRTFRIATSKDKFFQLFPCAVVGILFPNPRAIDNLKSSGQQSYGGKAIFPFQWRAGA
jgi:hypothetical protein